MSVCLDSELKSSPVIKRYTGNPVLSSKDVPYRSTCVYNAGAVKHNGRYIMAFRNDYGEFVQSKGFEGRVIGLAESTDGMNWTVRPKPCLDMEGGEITAVYDPRLTYLEGRFYMCLAAETPHGIRGITAVTDDFEKFEIIDMTVPDNRNLVMFPEKIGGKYFRLERPFPVYGRGRRDRFDIWISESPDLKHWGNSRLLLGVEDVPYANDKIGPGAPPLRTESGWLVIFHAVDIDPARGKNGWEETWKKRYTAGVMLLDLASPWKISGMYSKPLLVPEAEYEVNGGFRNNVIFPGGAVLEEDGEVKIYYGACDTVECLASARLDDLTALCG